MIRWLKRLFRKKPAMPVMPRTALERLNNAVRLKIVDPRDMDSIRRSMNLYLDIYRMDMVIYEGKMGEYKEKMKEYLA